ncbi:sterol desaturase family protein [Flavihumibacter petaseus]|uniref:Putative monooxygenase n=1 Tax=Flavihumibacter petaseus NBRC 106054 TaxID=1220578 RepID=A0A0E9MWG2_9BACT|nr:sterol desaturase family protein [Flavihumibacter petaseus]GAO41909.1 putative monooxygenase [Flavihumibacter petaseus NBRC 106054]
MLVNYMAFAIPLFLALMLTEYLVSRKQKKAVYHFESSITNISVGIAERFSDALITGTFFFVYDYLQKHYGIFTIKPTIVTGIVLLLLTDFVWYWYHRFAHEINLFWAAHVVHHQSEDFNYTVSARITLFQSVIRTGFWCILPVIGFPASMITAVLIVHGLYPFFIHTQLWGKWGILEYILVTPSHHRVHHASNPEYLDKNYGDIFIIWDKLFGTFQAEDGRPIVYGLTKPLRSNSFLWQHFHYVIELVIAMKRQPTFAGKVRLLFGRPDEVGDAPRVIAEKYFGIRRSTMAANRGLSHYVIAQVGTLLVLLFAFLLFADHIDWPFQILFTLFLLLTLINCGAILEQRTWVFSLEYARMILLCSAYLLYEPDLFMLFPLLALVTVTIIYYRPLKKLYLAWVY